MKHEMMFRFKMDGDELFPVRFLEWLATRMKVDSDGNHCGGDYPDERVVIDVVEVNGRRVIGAPDTDAESTEVRSMTAAEIAGCPTTLLVELSNRCTELMSSDIEREAQLASEQAEDVDREICRRAKSGDTEAQAAITNWGGDVDFWEWTHSENR
jgi:hypothetical protein